MINFWFSNLKRFMKNLLVVMYTLLSTVMFSQNEVNEKLSTLFHDLDLNKDFHKIAMKSSLKFKYGINRGVSFRDANGNIKSNDTSIYQTEFTKNPLIESKIKEGHISIRQQDVEVQSGHFSINEGVWFHSEEDMMKEYYNITALFEEFGYRVKNSTVQNENFETNFEFTEILMKTNSKKSTLTISYSIPPKYERDKEYFLAFVYTNH